MIFRNFWIRGVFWVELGLIMYERTIYIHILSYASIAVLTLLHKAQEVLHNVLGWRRQQAVLEYTRPQ